MKNSKQLKDIQSEPSQHDIPINQVGVSQLRYPVIVLDREGGTQHTVSTVSMYVELPRDFRGTHMSRFVEILNKYRNGISTRNLSDILLDMRERLNACRSFFDIEFPFFMHKRAPVSKAESLMEYMCSIHGDSAHPFYTLCVQVPVLSVCPCSKEISEYGAHNQRSIITIRVQSEKIVWIEDIIALAESSASFDLYSLLKREDEKFVTERSYENPCFVEDIVRNCANKLFKITQLSGFSVESTNMESIHNHAAYAKIVHNFVTSHMTPCQ